jgi:hypothetical protein
MVVQGLKAVGREDCRFCLSGGFTMKTCDAMQVVLGRIGATLAICGLGVSLSLRQRFSLSERRLWVVSANSPLWNAAVIVVDFEAGDLGLLDDPRGSSFRDRAVRCAREL